MERTYTYLYFSFPSPPHGCAAMAATPFLYTSYNRSSSRGGNITNANDDIYFVLHNDADYTERTKNKLLDMYMYQNDKLRDIQPPITEQCRVIDGMEPIFVNHSADTVTAFKFHGQHNVLSAQGKVLLVQVPTMLEENQPEDGDQDGDQDEDHVVPFWQELKPREYALSWTDHTCQTCVMFCQPGAGVYDGNKVMVYLVYLSASNHRRYVLAPAPVNVLKEIAGRTALEDFVLPSFLPEAATPGEPATPMVDGAVPNNVYVLDLAIHMEKNYAGSDPLCHELPLCFNGAYSRRVFDQTPTIVVVPDDFHAKACISPWEITVTPILPAEVPAEVQASLQGQVRD